MVTIYKTIEDCRLVQGDNSEALSYFHDNVEKGIFLPGSMETFYGLLKSPVYVGPSGNFNADVTIIEYSFESGILDTLSSNMIAVPDLSLDQSAIFDGFVDDDQIFFILQSQMYRFDVVNQSIKSVDAGVSLQSIFLFGEQVVVQTGGLKLGIYDRELVEQKMICNWK